MNSLKRDSTVLGGRYLLRTQIAGNDKMSLWEAEDQFGGPILIKAWPFVGSRPDHVLRALWDVELRNMFRLSSSPESEARIVVLKEASIDDSAFIMALTCPGLTPLEYLLKDRKSVPWLRELTNGNTRAAVWRGMRAIAAALSQLHQHQMLHRNVSPGVVFTSAELGPETMRLGGFEWTVRVGSEPTADRPDVLPPEFASVATTHRSHSFESDWFSFAVLVARVIAAAEPGSAYSPEERYKLVVDAVGRGGYLIDAERTLLLRMLIQNPDARLSRGYEIINIIDDIDSRLRQPPRIQPDAYLGLVALLGPGRPLTLAILTQNETTSATDIEAQRRFIEGDLQAPRIVRRQGEGEGYILVGNRLAYSVVEYSDTGVPKKGDWGLAFCVSDAQLRFATGGDDQKEIQRFPIRVFASAAMKQNSSVVRRAAVSWLPFLPRPDRFAAAQERQQRFHEFFRITNQIELLFRDAEIFAYRLLSTTFKNGRQEIVIGESARKREVPASAAIPGGLLEFLGRQRVEKTDGDLVYLGPEESLIFSRKVDRAEFWTIDLIDEEKKHIRLNRFALQAARVPQEGFLRAFEMFGQTKLIQRRRRAIDRLRQHTYLLQALQTPSFFYVDTGQTSMPVEIDPGKVDEAKRTALLNIWRTRPVFALQGPPGTGKTTLVANLLGQILSDDPVAQVLVTAQAHAAVDVLKNKVATEIFQDVDEEERPLAIRLPRGKEKPESDEDGVENVTLDLLERAEKRTVDAGGVSTKWRALVKEASLALRRGDKSSGAGDLCELVRRSANITYSTTTAGNLEELADMTQSFDWSLIEEAGKAHGFDLALPLQTGHRWLLIGDQDQLPPYRYNDFEKALRYIEESIEALSRLPERAGGLVDMDLVYRWRALEDGDREARQTLWLRWLPVFAELYRACFQAIQPSDGSSRAVSGLLAYMLHHQHRMHPDIAELISNAYYRGRIKSETIDEKTGKPLGRVLHPFTAPIAVRDRAIIWIDIPSAKSGAEGELGPDQGRGAYTSPVEVEAILKFLSSLRTEEPNEAQMRVAVLSPYRHQVNELSRALVPIYQNRPGWMLGAEDIKRGANTVDSFQGDQADVVIVSLVRNNRASPGTGLGFLRESARMNVLFSRAERLLVLVGSWDFFNYQVQEAPPDPDQPLGHWRIAIEYIEKCMKEGRATMLRTSDLAGGAV